MFPLFTVIDNNYVLYAEQCCLIRIFLHIYNNYALWKDTTFEFIARMQILMFRLASFVQKDQIVDIGYYEYVIIAS